MIKLLKSLWEHCKESWREIALTTLVATLALQSYQFTMDRPENRFVQSAMILAIAANAVGVWWLTRELWRRKWRDATTVRMQKIFARLQGLLEKVSDKIGFKKSKNSILQGKTTIKFDKGYGERAETKSYSPKPPKWKHMADNRSRMRYLYRGMITKKIRGGSKIYSYNTPSEIERCQEKTACEQELFDMYIGMRYDERKSPDPTDIVRLKQELDIN